MKENLIKSVPDLKQFLPSLLQSFPSRLFKIFLTRDHIFRFTIKFVLKFSSPVEPRYFATIPMTNVLETL